MADLMRPDPSLPRSSDVFFPVYADRFLLHALEASGGDLDEVLPTRPVVEATGSEAQAIAVVSLLRAKGWMTAEITYASGFVELVRLTPSGLTEACRLKTESTRRTSRRSYTRIAVLRWVDDTAPASGSADLQTFVFSPASWFCGDQLAWDEIHEAVQYLREKGLLEPYGGRDLALTPMGQDCVEAGTTVEAFMQGQQNTGPTQNFFGAVGAVNSTVHGGQVIAGNNATVNSGIDGAALAQLITQLRAATPALGLSAEEVAEYEADIVRLENAQDEEERRGVWQRIAPRLNSGVQAGSALATIVQFGMALLGG
ncbi:MULTISPECIES: hypothetical protein [Streptomyces]|uniref:hypothetical protein n=1 Tax=Streptomyces TaxID=1883 RepID=UPI002252F41B|nr:hypothetical protein [Streptomyces virginiae]MCX5270557.1 hypothetical protein [Streptomyces virginiae]WST21787.1 hypothetical protein OG264_09950 [Streptomyces xanthophaeus]WST63226.1 hypothetical protein OG605_28410 [Streptomyces xanthophaeus]